MSIDLFSTSQNHRCSIYFSPYHHHNAMVSHSGCFEEAPVVLWSSADHRSSTLASKAVVSGSSGSGGRRTGRSSTVQRPSASAPLPPVSSGSVQAVSSCLETIKQFTHAGGFSGRVAQQVSLARRPSSCAGYQSKWLVFRQWCRSEGHSISRPSLPKIADFLFWLRRSRRLSVSSVMDYRSMLSAVFKSVLPEISTSPVLHDLLRSFQEYEEPVYSYSTYPDRRFSSRYPNILKMSPPFGSSEGYRLVVIATRAMVCYKRTHCLILDYLASARGRVLERSHFLILLLLILLIYLYILSLFSPQ